MTRFAPPARCAAYGLDRASRDPFSRDYRRPARKCLTTVSGSATVGSSSPAAVRGPLHIARSGARSNRRSRPRFVPHFSSHFLVVCLCDVTSAKPIAEIGLRFGPRPGADPTVHQRPNHHAATAVRLSDVDASGAAPSAPISLRKNDDIDAQNGQAYHGRWTTIANGRRPTVPGSRPCEKQWTLWHWRGRIASRVRSRPGAAGRTRVLRA
jgi:hypothetical protein